MRGDPVNIGPLLESRTFYLLKDIKLVKVRPGKVFNYDSTSNISIFCERFSKVLSVIPAKIDFLSFVNLPSSGHDVKEFNVYWTEIID